VKNRLIKFHLAIWFLGAVAMPVLAQSDKSDSTESLKRISHDVKYLASDELEGRGVETQGIHLAADYIIEEFKKVGVKGGGKDGSYKQKFPVNVGSQLVAENTSLVLSGPMRELKMTLGKDFQSMMPGSDSDIEDVELVFVGYGISAGDDHNYDEYKDIDVEGKLVVMIRREPQSEDEDSVFNGKRDSRYARFVTKFRAAKKAGAVGVICVNDRLSSADSDELPQTNEFGTRFPNSGRIPFAFVTRDSINKVLGSSPVKTATGDKLDSIEKVESHIDETLTPVSQSIEGWKASFKTEFNREPIDAFNIIGVIEGEGPNADETIVIGGHYDHLGKGPYGSRAPGRKEVHNGADDNATGTAAILELARRFAKYDKKPGRRLVFVAFSGEERGLVGSQYWVNKEPLYPLDKTVAMVNYDMIGWLREDKLTIFGAGTADAFKDVFAKANEDIGLDLNEVPGAGGGSDHLPFNAKKIPNMFIHTGLTDTYHTPEDDYETLSMEGALKVIDFSEKVVWQLAALENAPEYTSRPRPRRPRRPQGGDSKKAETKEKAGDGEKSAPGFLGVQMSTDSEGVEVQSVVEGSAAAKGGIRAGDQILSVDGKEVKDPEAMSNAVSSKKAGDEIEVKIKRGDTVITSKFKLGKRED